MFQKNLSLLGATFRHFASNVPVRNITMRTTRISEFKTVEHTEQFSRKYLKDLVEKPTPEEQRQIDQEKQLQADIKRSYENPHNDRNPANHLRVKVNLLNKYKTEESSTTPALVDDITKNLSQPYVLLIQPKKEKVLVQGVRKKVPVSVKKLLPYMKMISGRHIYDAIAACLESRKKAAKYIAYALQQVKRHAIEKEMDEERLYVHNAITGKHKRFLRLRYHAKGTGAYMKKDTSRITIRLEERPIEDMYKDMMVGKTPPILAYMLRKSLLEKDADYEVIRRNSFILTAKGRQQRRLMFKRKVMQQQLAFREKGFDLSSNVIGKKILEEESRVFAERYRKAKHHELTSSLTERQALFKKNEEAAGV